MPDLSCVTTASVDADFGRMPILPCVMNLLAAETLRKNRLMKTLRILLLLLMTALWAAALRAQPPVPHELLGHKESTFKVPRTRPFDWYNFKWMGGGPDLEEECGGCCHCFGRPAVWRCYECIVPPDVPRWTVEGEYFELRRHHEDDQDIFFDSTNGAPLYSLEEMRFDYEPGYRLRAQFNLSHLGAFEAIYFRSQEMHIHDTFIDSTNAQLEAAGLIVLGTGIDPFQVQYETRVQSGEVNFRRYSHHGAVSLLAGARWLEIGEEMQIGELAAVDQLLVQTSNRLIGMQMGLEGQHWVDYGILRLDGSIKGGIYQNGAEQSSSFATAVAAAKNDDIAWMGEARGAVVFPLTPHLFIRGGYHVIHLSGLAIASDQINNTDLAVVPPTASLNTDGRAIYHGWFLGLEAWW